MTIEKYLKLGLAFIASFPLPGLGQETVAPGSATAWSIRGGPVELSSTEKLLVAGTFIVISPHADNEPLAAPRQGGACLVADLVPFGIGRASCTTSADCNAPDAIDKLRDPRLATYMGYCIKRDGSQEAPGCWTRPGPPETFCKRSVDSLRLTAGIHSLGPVDADPLGNGEPYPEWAVFACIAQQGHDRACGQEDSPYRQVSLTPLPPGNE